MRNACIYFFIAIFFLFIGGCKPANNIEPLFTTLEQDATGINFSNDLTPTDSFNVFHYMYYYNGAGVGAGDFNNDGLTDLFFASNQGSNKIFLNEGNLHFEDVTAEAKIPQDRGWSTGVSVVDINNDGLPDIYVCRVGNYEVLQSHNQFLICKGIDKNGVPYYEDESKTLGLDFKGFSTQAAFLDYDMDGDLDMYLLNHSLHQNGTYGWRNDLSNKKSPLSGDRFFRNDNGHFTDVTAQTGINSSVLGYGLGIAVADINMDGYPDLYIGNDFHENDYLYINQHNGTFKDDCSNELMHTSQYTMGVDVADLTNDGLPEILSMDMLPEDPYILKRSEAENQYDVFNFKLQLGYNYQYSHNNLQFNRGNDRFSETALYSGVAATDWSWAALLFDFDNDGYKDIFISNGIPKRLNDLDYINYVSSGAMQERIGMNNVNKKDLSMIDKFPQIKIPNKFYRNDGSLKFDDMAPAISKDQSTYSNGAVYADLDNDGDPDIVVNNIDAPALLYENNANDKKTKPSITINLKGDKQNINATGAKIIAFKNDSIRTYEKFPVHGFLSSMETPIQIANYKDAIDSLLIIWPDNGYQKLDYCKDSNYAVSQTYQSGLPKFDYSVLKNSSDSTAKKLKDITADVKLLHKHEENTFNEFDRDPLVPHMLSKEGPALAVADINGDKLDDVFIGGAKRESPVVFVQAREGGFQKLNEPALNADSVYEDIDACWVDVNNDNAKDLVVASGGNEYKNTDIHLLPRVYLNDGKGNLTRLANAFDNVYACASTVTTCDFNKDGFMDLFIGARDVPGSYGEIPRSYLLLNDGTGKFKDVTASNAAGLDHIGLVTNSVWCDIDKDGDSDLLVSLEWGGIDAFINYKGKFTKKGISAKKGWWNFILAYDIDNDGDIDLVAGNLGLNSRLKASEKEPVQLYYNDFDNNGLKEQVLTYYLGGRQLPFASIDELEKRMPILKKQYLYAADFSKASVEEIFTREKLDGSKRFSADDFSNSIFINNGNLNFTQIPMPWQAQLSSYRDAAIIDANGDKLPDILLMGNYYGNNIQMGRYDADYGMMLLNKGKANFKAETLNGLYIKGQVRQIKKIDIANKEAYILTRNNDSTMVISY
jgi:hypothetical protein